MMPTEARPASPVAEYNRTAAAPPHGAESAPARAIERPPFVPGVHWQMPAERYHAIEALSQSGATKLLRSPAHYLFERTQQQREPTDAMRFGTALHTAVLEPDRFGADVVRMPKVDRRTKEGKAIAAAFEADAAGKLVLTGDEFDRVGRSADAVRAHPSARMLLAGARCEVSALWRDPRYDVPCKVRFDALNLGGVVDLKSTDDASREAFARSIAAWGYHRQSSHYCEAHEVAFGAPPEFFVFVVVERDPPHGVACYAMPEAGIAAGRRQMQEAKARYATCVATGDWPCYPPTIEIASVPKYLLRFD